jgi:glutathione S-transferase
MTTLTYFPAYGRAEFLRMLLHHCGEQFNDQQIGMPQWEKMLGEGFSPNGFLPVLEIDGKKFGTTPAIAMYLAKKHNLVPTSPADWYTVMTVMDTVEGFKINWYPKVI